nr:DNA (cytosine-5-)-methyltransferase [uncultured Sphaerochaeta sp.]
MNLSDIHKEIIKLVPSLGDSKEREAIITHIVENPDIRIPLLDIDKLDLIRNYVRDNCANIEVSVPYPRPKDPKFKFIDLFAGIGGFRQAFQNLGGNCVFSSEWDKHAAETYYANYGVYPFGDIRSIDPETIPDHDILCAGFPCQPFSIAGVSKKNSMGRATGFEDKIQGTLFFEIAKILKAKRPQFIFLENVKNINSHDKGRTIDTIEQTFRDLNYKVLKEVVDGKEWVPQHRERVFFLGYDIEKFGELSPADFYIPKGPSQGYIYPTLDTIIDSNSTARTLSDGTWKALKRHKEKHASKHNGFGYSILKYPITPDQITWTISARYHKDGADCLVPQKDRNPRQLSLKEILRLQGFDDEKFTFPVGLTFAYKQLGNSVVVPAVEESAKILVALLDQRKGIKE